MSVSRYTLDQMIKDYNWMIKAIENAADVDDESIERAQYYQGAKISPYGIEAAMPKASGGTSDPVGLEVMRRLQYGYGSISKYKRHVAIVQERLHKVVGEKKQFVLHSVLDGLSFRQVAKNLGVSDGTVRNIYETVLDDMMREDG